MYWCALGRPARTFRRGLGIATLHPVSSPAAGFTTNPHLGLQLWESAVAQVLNHDRQRAAAATQRRCCVQAAAVGSFTSIYACGSRIRADVLVTHLAIRRAGDYDRIGRPVVHDGLERSHASRHG